MTTTQTKVFMLRKLASRSPVRGQHGVEFVAWSLGISEEEVRAMPARLVHERMAIRLLSPPPGNLPKRKSFFKFIWRVMFRPFDWGRH